MTPARLAQIREDDRRVDHEPGGVDKFLESSPVRQRRELLEYIDEVDRALAGTSDRLREILGAQRILLGLRILEDGHAKNLGEAIRIAEDLDQVATLYPWVED